MADARREYEARFKIGAVLAGSFRGVMAQAQMRLRGLAATAKRVVGAVGGMLKAFGGLFAIFGSFAAGAVLGKIFGGAVEEAQEAEERTRKLTSALMHNEKMRKAGMDVAKKNAGFIQENNELIAKQGVLSDDHLGNLTAQLALYRLSPKRIMESTKAMADQLVFAKGARATEEDATGFAIAHGKAIMKGQVKALEKYGIYMTKNEAKEFQVLAKAGKIEEAHKKLMDLYKKSAGENARALDTPTGKLVSFQKVMRQMSQDIGKELMPILGELADVWSKALPTVKPAIIGFLRQIGKFAKWAGEQVQLFMEYWKTPTGAAQVKELQDAAQGLANAIGDLGRAMGITIPQGEGFGTMIAKLVGFSFKVFTAELNALAAAVRGIQALPQVLADTWNWLMKFPAIGGTFQPLIDAFNELWNTLKQVDWGAVFSGLKTAAEVVFAPFIAQVYAVQWAWGEFLKLFPNAGNVIKSALGDVGQAIISLLLAPLKLITAELKVIQWAFSLLPKKVQPVAVAPPALAPPPPTAENVAPAPAPGPAQAKQFGGIINRATHALVGEAGPEAIIPLSGGRRAEGLLSYANRALGMGAPSASTTTVSFAPNITVNGNMSETEQRAMDSRLRDLAKDFIEQFKRAQSQERRLSYESGAYA